MHWCTKGRSSMDGRPVPGWRSSAAVSELHRCQMREEGGWVKIDSLEGEKGSIDAIAFTPEKN